MTDTSVASISHATTNTQQYSTSVSRPVSMYDGQGTALLAMELDNDSMTNKQVENTTQEQQKQKAKFCTICGTVCENIDLLWEHISVCDYLGE
ncbi:hypothetical protein GGI25_002656 [Coemansia spiralis]|uniref:Uncharacterized protein n=2 Tax=Coemansia TaxID=4863 RepID=A0A9W8G8E2_9FUNG|nr:hypothetical protein EDC05_002538 [Coemansia umbellata]KAJ2678013.1 hypothetical protein GGI25_002656 [Coemansia spiralis]